MFHDELGRLRNFNPTIDAADQHDANNSWDWPTIHEEQNLPEKVVYKSNRGAQCKTEPIEQTYVRRNRSHQGTPGFGERPRALKTRVLTY